MDIGSVEEVYTTKERGNRRPMAVRNGLPQSLATSLSVQGVCVLCIFQGLKGVSPDPSYLTEYKTSIQHEIQTKMNWKSTTAHMYYYLQF